MIIFAVKFIIVLAIIAWFIYSLFVPTSKPVQKKVKKVIPPEKGRWIKLIDLANPINNPSVKSCWIGVKGIVKENYLDGTFDLTINGDGGTLLVLDTKYKFEYLEVINLLLIFVP